jgi:hypothetical protein
MNTDPIYTLGQAFFELRLVVSCFGWRAKDTRQRDMQRRDGPSYSALVP